MICAYCLKFNYIQVNNIKLFSRRKLGETYNLVMNLMRNYAEKEHVLYWSNYYSSFPVYLLIYGSWA